MCCEDTLLTSKYVVVRNGLRLEYLREKAEHCIDMCCKLKECLERYTGLNPGQIILIPNPLACSTNVFFPVQLAIFLKRHSSQSVY